MERYYSTVERDKLIFCLLRYADITDRRCDLSPEEEYLQVCGRRMHEGVHVPSHRHIKTIRSTDMTQESWVILSGLIKASFYDVDNSHLCDRTLGTGDVIVLYRGGHSLTVLKDNTVFYEFKNGPYYGVTQDKENIDEQG